MGDTPSGAARVSPARGLSSQRCRPGRRPEIASHGRLSLHLDEQQSRGHLVKGRWAQKPKV